METAKMVATLDQLSAGRAIAGVGVGWSESKFSALGVPFRQRGTRTDEYLAIWQACWGPDPVTFRGKFFACDRMHIGTKPVQQPHPPVWIGGSSDAALRRAARFAQMRQPVQMPPLDLRERKAKPEDECEALGRNPLRHA
jgi:alkanesulfonate monooxygenase SsuD/methylene tetrahydromethanopterin reductase-like flavin-dependent oxidoreductase (luciferase family)